MSQSKKPDFSCNSFKHTTQNPLKSLIKKKKKEETVINYHLQCGTAVTTNKIGSDVP